MTNSLLSMSHFGQSLWLSRLSPGTMISGAFRRLRDESGLRGGRLDPAALERAAATTPDLDDWLRDVERGTEPAAIQERIAVRLIRGAADILAPVYVRSRRRDGFASLDISPWLAQDPAGLVAGATRLWNAIRRDNVLILLPATPAGLKATTELIAAGINTGFAHVLTPEAYGVCFEAYRRGLEGLAERGGRLDLIAGAAVFPVGRLDAAADHHLIRRLRNSRDETEGAELARLLGRPALSLARLAYRRFVDRTASPGWKALAARGARPLKLTWDGSGHRGQQRREVTFLEELIGPETNHLVTEASLEAIGASRLRPGLTSTAPDDVMPALKNLGLSVEKMTADLLDEILDESAAGFDRVTRALERKHRLLTAVAPSRRLQTLRTLRPAGFRPEPAFPGGPLPAFPA